MEGGRTLIIRDNAWAYARQAAGVSMRELERTSNVPRSILSLLEQGRYTPTPAEARRILAALGDGAAVDDRRAKRNVRTTTKRD